jgi:glutaconate CoA-transferase subunit B
VIGFDDETKRMKLISVHPGVTVEDVVENTGFELIIPDEVSETKPPTEVDLRLLREEIDSAGIVIGKK